LHVNYNVTTWDETRDWKTAQESGL